MALECLIKYSGAIAGAILVEKEGELVNTASIGISDPESLVENHVLYDMLKTSDVKRIDLNEDIKLDGILTKFRPVQIVAQPILFSNVASGVILLASSKYMDPGFIEQFDVFVHDFSLVLNNSLQHEQIQRLAALDPLTGIYNRRFGLSRLNEEFSRSTRSNSHLGIMMIDIDKFKMINDTHGHIAGDRFLKHLVFVITPLLRIGDFFVRYGGEEFLAILPGANKNDLFIVAERIRFAIGQSSIKYGEATISASVSIGLDSIPESNVDDPTNLIAKADTSLYEAKRGWKK